MKALRLLVLALIFSGDAIAEERTEQLAIFVGANVGAPEDEVLRYAESDARRVRALLVELGEVRADRAILVTGAAPTTYGARSRRAWAGRPSSSPPADG